MSPKKVVNIVTEGSTQIDSKQIIDFYGDMLSNEGYYSFNLAVSSSNIGGEIKNWSDFISYIDKTLQLQFLPVSYEPLKDKIISFIEKAAIYDTTSIQIPFSLNSYLTVNVMVLSRDVLSVFFKADSSKKICFNRLEQSLSQQIQEVVDIAYFVYDFYKNEVIASDWLYQLIEQDRLTKGNLLSEDLLRLFPRSERYYFIAEVSNALKNKRDFSFNASIKDLKGKSYHLKIAGSICFCVDGKPYKIHGTVLDITEQVILQNESVQENERFREFYDHTRMLFDSIKDFIWSKDVEGRFVFANNAMCRRVLGARYTEEPIGKTESYFNNHRSEEIEGKVFRMLHPFDIEKSDTEVLNNLVSQRYELEGFFGDSTCILEVQKTPVIDMSGKLLGLVGTARDITARKKVEKELKRSEHRLTESQQLARIGHWEYNISSGETMWSTEFYQVFQLNEKAVKPNVNTMLSWIVTEDRSRVKKEYQKAFKQGESINCTYRIALNGNTIYVRDICKVTKGKNGEVRKIYGTIQNISELKRSEIAAIRNRRRLENIVKALPDTVIIVDKGFNLLEYFPGGSNENLLRLDKFLNKSLYNAFASDDAEGLKKCIKKSLAEGGIEMYEFPFGKGRFRQYLEVRVSPFEKDKVVMVVSNRTEQKKTQKDLENAMLKAEESDRLKSAFLANMSHEIRTPLNAIVGFSNMLGDEEMRSEDKSRFLEIIARNSDQLLALISDIIDVSKIESDQLEVILGYLDLNTFVTRIHKQFVEHCHRVGKTDITFRKEQQYPDRQVIVQTDLIRFEQIVSNLINNAIKFTEKGFIDIGYHLENEGRVIIYVRDTGIGIAKKNQKVIFDRFRQEDFSITRKYGGTGLGLAICKKLAILMGGDITVESKKGQGSTFFLELPYNKNLIDDM